MRVCQPHNNKGGSLADGYRKDTESLAHTTWECKYHVVFAPKYRRQVIYKDIRKDIGTYCESCANTKG